MLLDPARWISYLAAILCLIAIAVVASAAEQDRQQITTTNASTGGGNVPDPWAGAQARIDRYRKAGASIQVKTADGKPLAGVTLKIEQTRHAFLFGSNIFNFGRIENPQAEAAYRRRFAELLNYATLPFYWASYERQQGQPMHERTAEIVRWCAKHGIRTKGHPLAWNHSEPYWLPDDTDAILELQLDRIRDCAGRFAGQIDIWDVVNEATHYDRPEFLRRSPKYTAMWREVGQVEFTRRCFQAARRANPKATLLINDYRVDAAYERLIEQLIDDDGKPLYDAIGIQSHQHGGVWSNEKIWDVCQRFSKFGVPLHFTETTILSGERPRRGAPRRTASWSTTTEGETKQAKEVERFYTMLYSCPAVEAITWWDFSDYRAWQAAPAGFLRRDMSPKPAYEVLHKLIKQRWWTSTEAVTDAQGKAGFRGILGDYRVTVHAPGKPPISLDISLCKGKSNDFTVKLQ